MNAHERPLRVIQADIHVDNYCSFSYMETTILSSVICSKITFMTVFLFQCCPNVPLLSCVAQICIIQNNY